MNFDALLAVAEDAGNRLLRLDAHTLVRLGDLQGKALALEVREPAVTVYVLPTEGGLRLRTQHDCAPDARVRGSLPALLALARTGRTGPERDDGIEIAGDLELAQRFQRVLREIDVDWEEQLASVVGDIAAHRIGNAVRAARGWLRAAGDSLGRDAAEYLQEEQRALPHPQEVAQFLRDVDELRADVDRLEQRLRLLGRRA